MTTPVWLLSCLDPESLLCRILNRPCFRRAGKLSLAIYCNHAFVIRILTALLIPRLEGAGVRVPDMMKGGMLFVLLTAYSLLTLAGAEDLSGESPELLLIRQASPPHPVHPLVRRGFFLLTFFPSPHILFPRIKGSKGYA